VPAEAVSVRAEHVLDLGFWSYTTVIADLVAPVTLRPNWESLAMRWVELDDVERLPLLPDFASTWAELKATL